MNYVQQLKAFRLRKRLIRLGAPAIALWHELAATANETGTWDMITLPLSTLANATDSSIDTIKRARNTLKQCGLIEWDRRGGNQSAVYRLYDLAVLYAPQPAPQPAPQTAPQPAPQSAPIYLQNNTNKTEAVVTEAGTTAAAWMPDGEAHALQASHNEVYELAERVGMPMDAYSRASCERLMAEYTPAWVLAALERAGMADAKARSWRYVEGALRGARREGGFAARQQLAEGPSNRFWE